MYVYIDAYIYITPSLPVSEGVFPCHCRPRLWGQGPLESRFVTISYCKKRYTYTILFNLIIWNQKSKNCILFHVKSTLLKYRYTLSQLHVIRVDLTEARGVI